MNGRGWAKGTKWTHRRRTAIMKGIRAYSRKLREEPTVSDIQPQPPEDKRKRKMSDETKRKLGIAMRKAYAKKKELRQLALKQSDHPITKAVAQAGNVSSEELHYIAYAVERLNCPVTVEVVAAMLDLSVAIHAAMLPKKREPQHGP